MFLSVHVTTLRIIWRARGLVAGIRLAGSLARWLAGLLASPLQVYLGINMAPLFFSVQSQSYSVSYVWLFMSECPSIDLFALVTVLYFPASIHSPVITLLPKEWAIRWGADLGCPFDEDDAKREREREREEQRGTEIGSQKVRESRSQRVRESESHGVGDGRRRSETVGDERPGPIGAQAERHSHR